MPSLLRDRRAQIGLAAVAVLVVVLIVVLVASGPSSSDGGGTQDATATTATSPAATIGTDPGATTTTPTSTPSTVAPPTSNMAPPSTTRDPHAPLADLPLTVTQSATSGLKDGDKVSFHIVPDPGSQAFGVSIRLCRADATFPALDDFEPATAGKCIGHALSPDSDLLVETAGNPPYQGLDAEFRVGVGTDTYTMTDGTPVSITCGPSSPCQLVLLLQVPNAYGFRTYPVTYR